jgi:hypothetical protein
LEAPEVVVDGIARCRSVYRLHFTLGFAIWREESGAEGEIGYT